MSIISSLQRVKFLLLALIIIPALACQFSVSTATITNAVMAKETQGDNFEPVGVTDTYDADQAEFHAVVTIANAPSDTKVKAVWTAVDLGAAAAPNTALDETEVTVEGSRNVDFTLTPDGGAWPPGAYKVDLYLNDKLDRTLNFTVAGAPEAAEAATVEPTATIEATATVAPTEAAVVETPTAEAATGSAEIIAAAVTAIDVSVLTSTPIGVTAVFPPAQKVVHTVVTVADAPAGTTVKAVWMVIDAGDAAPPNTQIGETETAVEGSQNIDFTFEAGGEGFPPGDYQVDVYLNDDLAQTVNFSVVGEDADAPVISIPTPAPVGSCPPLPSPAYQPSGFVKGITIAQDTQGAEYEPVNPGRVFPPDATFHAVVALENAPDNTEIKARWYVQDVGGAEPCNTEVIQPFTLTTSGSRNLDFTLQPPPGAAWPLGVYRIEIYVNGNLDLDVDFNVE
ncbi:MAG: hypothetical protein AB1801_25480 [Chloroflexota bacterium]